VIYKPGRKLTASSRQQNVAGTNNHYQSQRLSTTATNPDNKFVKPYVAIAHTRVASNDQSGSQAYFSHGSHP